MKRLWQSSVMVLAIATILLIVSTRPACAQATAETDAAESMGVGMKSRFASGATPITIERTKIIPGTPMSVRSTMSNMLSSNNGASFGGILARYDTSNFGKFFGTGQLPARQMSQRVQQLEALDQGDNEVENVDVARMYPPRLVVDFNELPTHSLGDSVSRENMKFQIENVLSRFEFDRKTESIRAENQGSVVVLSGRVKSKRVAQLVANIVSMQPGVESVVNQIETTEPEGQVLDVFGRPKSRQK